MQHCYWSFANSWIFLNERGRSVSHLHHSPELFTHAAHFSQPDPKASSRGLLWSWRWEQQQSSAHGVFQISGACSTAGARWRLPLPVAEEDRLRLEERAVGDLNAIWVPRLHLVSPCSLFPPCPGTQSSFALVLGFCGSVFWTSSMSDSCNRNFPFIVNNTLVIYFYYHIIFHYYQIASAAHSFAGGCSPSSAIFC